MRNIPSVLLDQIFVLLSQEDHFECMLVCHLWKDIIERYSLFHTLRIYSFNNLESVIEKLYVKPIVRYNVEKITCYLVDLCSADSFRFKENLPNFFAFLDNLPKLREFNCFIPDLRYMRLDGGSKLPWHRRIEIMSEEISNITVSTLLAAGMCPNLTVLTVRDLDTDIISLLKNAPALKNVTLISGNIDFDYINAIHEALPLLKALTLKSKTIRGTFDKYTTPAKSITEFNLDDAPIHSHDVKINLLQYIKIKYPQLVYLSHNNPYYSEPNKDELEQLHKQGWWPLFENLGSQLKKLQIHRIEQIQNILEILDINHCQIQTLYLKSLYLDIAFPSIAQSQQFLYIKTLTLINFRIDSFDWLRELEVLESLDIQIKSCTPSLRLNFNNFIQNCPDSLLLLSLANYNITIEIINAIQYNIQTLTLINCNIPRNMDWFIYRHFPLLSNLTLDTCIFYVRKFDMKSIDLQTFCFIQKRTTIESIRITALVQTYHGFEQRWYSSRAEDAYVWYGYEAKNLKPTEFPPVISRPASEIKEKPYFTLYCRSLGQIFLGEKSINFK